MDKDLMHALINCSHAKRFWDEALTLLGVSLPWLHPLTWARDILCDQRFTDQDRAKIITVMWSIWHSRNKWKHDQEQIDPVFSVKTTREALSLLAFPQQQVVLPGHGWRPPELEYVKINTDGAINFADGNGGAGGVARSSSHIVGAWSKPLPGITDPLIAECMAVRDGVLFAKIRGLTHVSMETDCLESGPARNKSNHGSTAPGILVPVTHRVSDPPSTRPARGRGTSAHARARRPGRTPTDRASGLASRRPSLSSSGRQRPPHHHRSTEPRSPARYPSTGWKIPAGPAGDWTGRPASRFCLRVDGNPSLSRSRTGVRIPRRNEPPPLYIPPHRTARVEDSSEHFRPTQASERRPQLLPAWPLAVFLSSAPSPISLALAPLLLSRELARLLSLLLWPSAAQPDRGPRSSAAPAFFYLVLNMSTSAVQIYFWCILLFANVGISAYLPLERDALLDVKSHLEDPQNYLSNWDESHSPCEFYGVRCDKISGEVTGVSLSNVSLSGTISPSFSVLRQLHTLDLSANSISGIIPAVLTSCTNLQVFNLSMNSLAGQLPDLSSLLKLQVLDLSTNSFSGAFPVWISKLSGLTELGLGENNFDEGDVPESIGLLTNLTWLFLGQCNLRGEIPASVFDLESLGTLDFSRNQMTGVFPKAISKLHNLWKIELYQNNLTGEILPELAHLTLLSEFDVSQNQLTGVLPKEIVRLKKLKVFHIYRNNFYGELPEGLGDLQFLESFSTYENQFSGKFPGNLGRFSPLNAIDISENFFSGEFPKFLCQNNKLQFLLALSNNFSGEFPSSYSSCKTLERFRVSQNQFTGSIPYGMWGLPNAVIIDVANNGFVGGISSDIGISATLSQLLVQDNNFSGELPKELGNLSQLQKLDASNNRFSGQIPTQIGNLKQLSYLHLQHNAVEGSIHPEIGLCNSLVDLNLAENSLSGEIPDTLGSLLMLNSLNLSHNMISGEIPEGLQSLKLSYVDFSHNNLSGPVPLQLLMIAGDDAFSENSDLCVSDTSEGWRQSSTSLPPCQWTDNHHNFSRRRLLAVLIIVSSLVVLLSSLACLRYENNRLEVFNRKLDTESGDDSDPKWIIEAFRPPEVNPSAALPLPMVTQLLGDREEQC